MDFPTRLFIYFYVEKRYWYLVMIFLKYGLKFDAGGKNLIKEGNFFQKSVRLEASFSNGLKRDYFENFLGKCVLGRNLLENIYSTSDIFLKMFRVTFSLITLYKQVHVKILVFLWRPVEMKKILGRGGGGATNYEILSATMIGWRRKFFISNRLKGIEKLDICRSQVI